MNKFTLREFEKNIEDMTNEKIVLIGCQNPEVLREVFNVIIRELDSVYPLENSSFDNIDLSFRKSWDMNIQDVKGNVLIFQPDLEYDSIMIPDISRTLLRWFNKLGRETNIIFIVTKKMLDDLVSYTDDFQEQYRRLYGFQVVP